MYTDSGLHTPLLVAALGLVRISLISLFNLRSSLISCLSWAFIYRVSMYATEVTPTTIHMATPIKTHQTSFVVATLATQKIMI